MLERHVFFDVRQGEEQEFVRFFLEHYRPAMAQTPGFVRAELLQELESPRRVVMVLRFDDRQASDRWRASGAHESLKPQLRALYAGSEKREFEVIA